MLQYGPVDLPWDNLFDFEWGMVEEDQIVKIKQPFDEKLCDAIYDTYQSQKFSLPVLRKLFSSCKYFFAKQPTPICYRLHVDEDSHTETQFCDESIALNGSTNLDLVLKNAYITGSIDFKDCMNFPNDLMSRIISRLYRCEARYINIRYQKLSFNELKFLIPHGEVVQVHAEDTQILDENGDYVELEAIMEFLSNIESLWLSNVKVTAKTAHCLTKQHSNGKIQDFGICNIYGEPFDSAGFLKFCIANRDDEEFSLYMNFNKEFNAAFVEEYYA